MTSQSALDSAEPGVYTVLKQELFMIILIYQTRLLLNSQCYYLSTAHAITEAEIFKPRLLAVSWKFSRFDISLITESDIYLILGEDL
jgi:hypothetical protein